MGTYWDDFWEKYAHRIRNRIAEPFLLQAFWYYCDGDIDECERVLREWDTALDSESPAKAQNSASTQVCQWCGKPGGYEGKGPLLRYHQGCAYDADCT